MVYLYKYILKQKSKKLNNKHRVSLGVFYLEDSVKRIFPNEEIKIFKDSRGKPQTDRKNIFVSVSHSENIVICAVSELPVGVDTEIIREKLKYKKIAERFFTCEEQTKIQTDGEFSFYEIWCRKEAFSKVDGRGLSYGIKNIGTVNKNNEFFNEIEGIPVTGKWTAEGFVACAGGNGDIKWIEIRE